MTEIVVATENQDRAKRIAAGVSELMADEGFQLQKVKNLVAGGESHIILNFSDPPKEGE